MKWWRETKKPRRPDRRGRSGAIRVAVMRWAMAVSLLLCVSNAFAQRTAAPAAAKPDAAAAAASAPAAVSRSPRSLPAPAPDPDPAPAPVRHLDLRVGKVARFLPPAEAAKLQNDRTPPAEIEAVVIEGQRQRIPDRLHEPVPGGPAGVIWGLFHPTQLWRLFVPDPNAPPAEPPRSDRAPAVPRIGCGPNTNVPFCD